MEAAGGRVAALRKDRARISQALSEAARPASLAGALSAGPQVAVLAEIKRHSPSRGPIAPGLDAAAQAQAYASGGAAAISVLTEPTRFGGDVADLRAACGAGVPLLRKDFVVDGLQLAEARGAGASAALLIVRALAASHLRDLYDEGVAIGLDLLVEVHDEWELELALDQGYPLIGVNTRDLETLEMDAGTGARLLPRIDPARVAVYESGIRTVDDVARAADSGADAVLVGTAVSEAADPAAAVRALTGVDRRPRRAS